MTGHRRKRGSSLEIMAAIVSMFVKESPRRVTPLAQLLGLKYDVALRHVRALAAEGLVRREIRRVPGVSRAPSHWWVWVGDDRADGAVR